MILATILLRLFSPITDYIPENKPRCHLETDAMDHNVYKVCDDFCTFKHPRD